MDANGDSVDDFESNFDTNRPNTCNQQMMILMIMLSSELCDEPKSNVIVKRLHSKTANISSSMLSSWCFRQGSCCNSFYGAAGFRCFG